MRREREPFGKVEFSMRNMPHALRERLRAEAAVRHMSLERLVIEALERGLTQLAGEQLVRQESDD